MTVDNVEIGVGSDGKVAVAGDEQKAAAAAAATRELISSIKTRKTDEEEESLEQTDEETAAGGAAAASGGADPSHNPGMGEDAMILAAAKDENDSKRQRRTCALATLVETVKYVYSSLLFIFCVAVVHAAMFTRQTIATVDLGLHPAVSLIIFWFLILWLGVMEGGLGALVGLYAVDPSFYAESHPRSLKNTTIAHKGDNLERVIVGRQYLVVLVITVINIMGSSIAGAHVFGFPKWADEVFLATGVAMILTTITIQLTAQVNSANCMLDFINNYAMLFTVYVSLAIEFSGLLHCVYLVQIIFAKLSGISMESNEPPRSTLQNVFFWIRVFVSLVILGFCLAFTLVALFDGKTGMWQGVPPAASVGILFILMAFVGLMEGMQIALFAVVNLTDEEFGHHSIAQKNCQLTFKGKNLKAFLIGRQILVATCMFVVARIATPAYGEGGGTIWGVSAGFQNFLNSGLTGAVITTVIGSLAWRIIASSFPLPFLSNPLIYVIIRMCLILDASGICSAARILGRIIKYLAGYKPDGEYIGTPQERAAISIKSVGSDLELVLEEPPPPPEKPTSMASILTDEQPRSMTFYPNSSESCLYRE